MKRLLLVLLVLGGCARPPSREVPTSSSGPRYFGSVKPPAEDVLTYNNGAEPERIDPGVISGQPDGRVVRTIFEGLTIPNPKTLEPEPGQAYRWEVSADGRTHAITVKPLRVSTTDDAVAKSAPPANRIAPSAGSVA